MMKKRQYPGEELNVRMLDDLDDHLATLTLYGEKEVAMLALKLQVALVQTYGERVYKNQ